MWRTSWDVRAMEGRVQRASLYRPMVMIRGMVAMPLLPSGSCGRAREGRGSAGSPGRNEQPAEAAAGAQAARGPRRARPADRAHRRARRRGAWLALRGARGSGRCSRCTTRTLPITCRSRTKLHQNNVGLTEIYDRGGPPNGDSPGGTHLGDLTNPDAQLLDPVTLDQISPFLIQATISTEDNSFETNPGVNIHGLFRAGSSILTAAAIQPSGTGGSSITQQLIKNVYICPTLGTDEATRRDVLSRAPPRTVDRKLREIVYALELGKRLRRRTRSCSGT